TLRHVGDAEPVGAAHAGVRGDQLPCQLVGADVQAAPALCVGDEAGHRHGALEKHREFFAFLHVFPVAGVGAAHFFLRIQLIGGADLFFGVAARLAGAHFFVLAALFAGVVALGAEAPAVGFGNLVAFLVEEIHMVDLLDRAARKARLVLDQVFKIGFGADFVVAAYGLVPGPVGPRPHGVHAGQAAHVSGNDAAGGKQKAGQGDDAAIAGVLRVLRVAPQRVVVANAVRIVADVVARGLVAPGFGRGADLYADAGAQLVQAAFGDLGKTACGFGLGQHGVSVSSLELMFGNGRALRRFLVAQFLAVNLSCRRLGQFRHEHHLAGILVLAQLRAYAVLDFADKGLVAWPACDYKGLHDLAAHGVGHADGGGLCHVGVFQNGVFDLDGAHGPAGRDNHVIGTAAMPEVAVFIRASQVFGGHPFAAPPNLQFARHAGRAGGAAGILHLRAQARHRLAQRTRLDLEVQRAGVADQAHADFGSAVHAAG